MGWLWMHRQPINNFTFKNESDISKESFEAVIMTVLIIFDI